GHLRRADFCICAEICGLRRAARRTTRPRHPSGLGGSQRAGGGVGHGLNWAAIRATIRAEIGKMKIRIVVHEAEEGGFWAEVPAIPGCASQGDSMDELMQNLREAIEGCLSVEVAPPEPGGSERMLELPA